MAAAERQQNNNNSKPSRMKLGPGYDHRNATTVIVAVMSMLFVGSSRFHAHGFSFDVVPKVLTAIRHNDNNHCPAALLQVQSSTCLYSQKQQQQQQDNANGDDDNTNNKNPWQTTTTTTTTAEDSNRYYTRDVRLREEAESPFRRVRFFLYTALGGGAVTSLVLSLARIAAASSGINADLMQESLLNAGVDVVGLLGLALLWQRDAQAQESRLQRATKGASLAKLAIRVNKAVSDPLYSSSTSSTRRQSSFTSLTLADLRRDRGIEKRVVIAAAGNDTIQQVLEEARQNAEALERTDLLLVPVVLPQATAPILEADTDELPDCVALPVGTAAWKAVLEDESKQARTQNVDIEKEGFCVILKKNGRVGQRTRGIYLDVMIGDVNTRKDSGFDVTNI